MTVTITGDNIRDSTGCPDNRPWFMRATDYQEGTGGGIITPGADWILLRPSSGGLRFQAEPGAVVNIKNPDGAIYLVTIPEIDSKLWDVLSERDAMGLKWAKTQSGEVVRLFTFRPGEHTDYTIGWDRRLAGDDEIEASSFEIVGPGVDEPLEVFSPTENGYNAQVWVRGTPEVGDRYELACTVTTVKGRTLRQVFALEIEYPAAESSPAATIHAYVTPSADRYWRLPPNPSAEDVLL